MIKSLKQISLLIAVAGLLVLNSCKKDEPSLPDNLVTFNTDQLGMAPSETEATITLTSTRAVTTNSIMTINVAPSEKIAYGPTGFITDPAAVDGIVTVTLPANATTVSFKVKKTGTVFVGDEKVSFSINQLAPGFIEGAKPFVSLTFGEIISTAGSQEVTGGGALYPNKVFIDLSGNRQTVVARTAWDLGFSSADDFRVILNSSNGMMAYPLTGKTDLNAVTAADTAAVQLGSKLSLPAVFAAITSATVPAWTDGAINWIDYPTGDLTKTAIAAVSATASENIVYIVNRGEGPGTPGTELGWKKIRIIRNGSNYTIQHADIGAASFTETTVLKDTNFRFNYFSFANGAVSVEPMKTKWDIAWTGFANMTNFGPPNTPPFYPYYFQDMILQNSVGVQTIQILNSAGVSYDAFAEANIPASFGTQVQTNIGSNWRSGGGPGTAPSIRTDRYYIIKDADGNVYKLRFTALTTNGERGKPALEYKLVKKA